MKAFLIVVLMAFSLAAWAGDSGLYFNPDRNGEGISLQRNGDTVVTYFYTYGAETCPDPDLPTVSPVPDEIVCGHDGQRWFLAVDDIVGNVVSGLLYITEGQNYPGSGTVGDETPVGTYTLVRDGDGWAMAVNRFGPALDADDYIFATIFEFTTKLLSATD